VVCHDGYTREEWESVPNPWASRIHPDDRAAVQLQIRKHLGGRSTSIEPSIGSAPPMANGNGC